MESETNWENRHELKDWGSCEVRELVRQELKVGDREIQKSVVEGGSLELRLRGRAGLDDRQGSGGGYGCVLLF